MAVGYGYGEPGPGHGQPGRPQPGYLQPGPGPAAPAYGRAQMRAADADRNWVIDFLKGAFADGRLTKDDYDTRVGHALAAQTYADLDALLADLRVPTAAPAQTNSLAVASLACGLGQLIMFPLPTIPAIVLGHVARRQIQRTGEKGAGMALAGLLLGWGGVVIGVLIAAVIVLFVAAVAHGTDVVRTVHPTH